jgi:hypothetical protein
MQKEYDNELTGYLWHETGSSVMRKGTVQVKGQKRYAAIIKSTNNVGEEKYELMISAGLLHVNAVKTSDRSPDISGTVTIDGLVLKMGGWRKVSDKGDEYTSISFREKDEVKQSETTNTFDTQTDDVPF